LKAKEQLEDKSYFSEVYSFCKKAFYTLVHPLAASFLVSAMEGDVKTTKFYESYPNSRQLQIIGIK
jgi:hypothetical protein